MIDEWWFMVSPIHLGLKPFDTSATHVDISGSLFKSKMMHWQLGPLGEYQLFASPL